MSTDPYTRAVGQRVYYRRRRMHYTQERLAKLVHLTRSSIANIECGRQGLTAQTIADLSRVLHCSADWLLGIERRKPEEVSEEMLRAVQDAIAENVSARMLVAIEGAVRRILSAERVEPGPGNESGAEAQEQAVEREAAEQGGHADQ